MGHVDSLAPDTRVFHSRRLADWWVDDPANPGRATLDNPAVRRLLDVIAPGDRVSDLGGTMSLNVRIERAGWVLRVHQPFVSRGRLLALQEIRRGLVRQGLAAALPVAHGGVTVFRCGDRWAELETYLPHMKPSPTPASFLWLFAAMGHLHRALNALDVVAPRPLVATYAPPGSLRRWLQITAARVTEDGEAREIVRQTHDLLARLRRRWVPAAQLSSQLVHGDARLGNLCRGPEGETVYLDFGFLARRPRIHELAYSLAFMWHALDVRRDPARFAWEVIPPVIAAYESAAPSPLSALERAALPASTASVPLYFAALAGFAPDPLRQLQAYVPFLRLSAWLLAHPDALLTG